MSAQSKAAVVGYGLLTAIIVLTQAASGVADLVGVEDIVKGVTGLGYPAYVLNILGPAKIAGAVVLAVPGVLRLKEWAYAGFSIDFLGAFSSHIMSGDGFNNALPALVMFGILMGSYFLRPASRTLAP